MARGAGRGEAEEQAMISGLDSSTPISVASSTQPSVLIVATSLRCVLGSATGTINVRVRVCNSGDRAERVTLIVTATPIPASRIQPRIIVARAATQYRPTVVAQKPAATKPQAPPAAPAPVAPAATKQAAAPATVRPTQPAKAQPKPQPPTRTQQASPPASNTVARPAAAAPPLPAAPLVIHLASTATVTRSVTVKPNSCTEINLSLPGQGRVAVTATLPGAPPHVGITRLVATSGTSTCESTAPPPKPPTRKVRLEETVTAVTEFACPRAVYLNYYVYYYRVQLLIPLKVTIEAKCTSDPSKCRSALAKVAPTRMVGIPAIGSMLSQPGTREVVCTSLLTQAQNMIGKIKGKETKTIELTIPITTNDTLSYAARTAASKLKNAIETLARSMAGELRSAGVDTNSIKVEVKPGSTVKAYITITLEPLGGGGEGRGKPSSEKRAPSGGGAPKRTPERGAAKQPQQRSGGGARPAEGGAAKPRKLVVKSPAEAGVTCEWRGVVEGQCGSGVEITTPRGETYVVKSCRFKCECDLKLTYDFLAPEDFNPFDCVYALGYVLRGLRRVETTIDPSEAKQVIAKLAGIIRGPGVYTVKLTGRDALRYCSIAVSRIDEVFSRVVREERSKVISYITRMSGRSADYARTCVERIVKPPYIAIDSCNNCRCTFEFTVERLVAKPSEQAAPTPAHSVQPVPGEQAQTQSPQQAAGGEGAARGRQNQPPPVMVVPTAIQPVAPQVAPQPAQPPPPIVAGQAAASTESEAERAAERAKMAASVAPIIAGLLAAVAVAAGGGKRSQSE